MWSDFNKQTNLSRDDNHIMPLTREASAGSFFIIQQKIFNKWKMGLMVKEEISDYDIITQVNNNPGAIGYIHKSTYDKIKEIKPKIIPILGLYQHSYVNEISMDPDKSSIPKQDLVNNVKSDKKELTKAEQFEQDDLDELFYIYDKNPLLTDFYVITHKETDKYTKLFIDFIYSKKGLEITKNRGFIPYTKTGERLSIKNGNSIN